MATRIPADCVTDNADDSSPEEIAAMIRDNVADLLAAIEAAKPGSDTTVNLPSPP